MAARGTHKLNAEQKSAIARLVLARDRLVVSKGKVRTRTPVEERAACSFLHQLAHVTICLGAHITPRTYRKGFTVNYRALFEDDRLYYVHVLDAYTDGLQSVVVNGELHDFSEQAVARGRTLRCLLLEILSLLAGSFTSREILGAQLVGVLEDFDAAWAVFEERYILELIQIEQRSFEPLLNAIHADKCLLSAESFREEKQQQQRQSFSFDEIAEHEEVLSDARRHMVAQILKLNNAASSGSSTKVGVEVLEAALDVTRVARNADESDDSQWAAQVLSEDVLASFDAIRGFLRETELHLKQVNPQLSCNEKLVQLLTGWAQRWECGARFLVDVHVTNALDSFIAQLREIKHSSPAFAALCDSCDAELFLVLPRLFMLSYLGSPDQQRGLVQLLMPHRFSSGRVARADDALHALHESSRRIRSVLQTLSVGLPAKHSWDLLVAAAIGDETEFRKRPEATVVQEFVLELETWSMELQRRCPEDWNQCSAVIMRALQAPERK